MSVAGGVEGRENALVFMETRAGSRRSDFAAFKRFGLLILDPLVWNL